MLEYMLMRPLERPIFERTRDWLAAHEDERLMLVVDEAHLYRGAAGAEVGLLLRRLRDRLGIPKDRLQVICTSASFNDRDYAAEFAAELCGTDPDSFVTPDRRPCAPGAVRARGIREDASVLASVSLSDFYGAESDEERLEVLADLLAYRGVTSASSTSAALFQALQDFPPMGSLVNMTMKSRRAA